MTSLKLFGAALVLAAMVAPASAQVSEPAAAASLNPNFSIYSSDGNAFGSYRPMAPEPYNANAMAGTRMPLHRHRAHRAPIRHY